MAKPKTAAAKRPAPAPHDLPNAIRRAAKRQGLTIEALREKAGLSNGRFYELLKGDKPKKLDAIAKLKQAGVRVPRDIVIAA